MARKRPDDEEHDIDEPELEAVDNIDELEEEAVDIDDAEEEPVDLDDAEEEAADVDEPIDLDEPLDADGDSDKPGVDEEEEDDADAPLRPRTPILAIVLVILNFLAAPPFVLLALMDYGARQQWAHATLLHRIYPLGLPLKEDEDAASVWSQTRPRLRIDSDKIKEVYNSRPKATGTKAGNEPFQPVDTIDEPIQFAIKPSQIGESIKRDLFSGLGPGVSTLEEEVDRLKKELPSQIKAAADKFVTDQGTEAKKKAAVEKILLPLAWSPKNVENLQGKINAAKGDKLDELLNEAVQRRMLVDLLAPLNVFRPGDPQEKANIEDWILPVEKVADLNLKEEFKYTLAALNELLQKRFDEAVSATYIGQAHMGESRFDGKARDDFEKRRCIAFLLVSVGRLKAPESKEPLIDKAFERAQVVSGFYEFATAAANYVRTLRVLEQRILYAIDVDLQGYVVRDEKDPTKVMRTNGFVGEHAADVARLKKVAAEIEFTKKRLKDLAAQRDRYQKQYEDRAVFRDDVANTLVESRKETFKLLNELRLLQKDIFEAQLQLSGAAERNTALELRIVEAELQLLKAGKKQ